MLVSDFDYSLPEDLIAQRPPAVRGSSRMLTLDRISGRYEDRLFAELPSLLQPGDLVVLNDSRVLPARLFATRGGLTTQQNSPAPSGHVEVLLTEALPSPEGHNDWRALVRPAKKIQLGETLLFHASPIPEDGLAIANDPPNQGGPSFAALSQRLGAGEPPSPALTATVLSTGCYGERTLRFAPTPDFHATLERIGHLPLPPYIHRDKTEPNTPEDRERYQTVFSSPFATRTSPLSFRTDPLSFRSEAEESAVREPRNPSGSAAAPTAGLHFTPEILAQLNERGIETARITLHVGLGTFQPVRAERTEDIRLHAEPYTLSAATADALNRARREGRRIVAVGTTTTRTLEHIARQLPTPDAPIEPHSGSTSLFLSPGLNSEFKLVQGLLTNFHLPQSTLLMLVSAFASQEHVLTAYAHAVAERYRFFSYGDCMLLL